MLQKGKMKKVLTATLVLLVITFVMSSVYADINWDYYNRSVSGMTVVDSELDSKVGGSSLLSALGLLIYSIASLMEWVLGSMYQLITGTNIFPWADAILFNAIPILDINFINPAAGVGTLVSSLQSFLSGMYATVMGLATTFFAVAVMVMAIKLLITTIASEKAKYKEAVVQWLTGLVLMYAIHYGISFVFYLNENLVNVASDMVEPQLVAAQSEIAQMTAINEADADKAVDNFITSMESFKITDLLSLGINRLVTTYDSEYFNTSSGTDDIDAAKTYIRDNSEVTVSLLQSKAYTDWRFGEKDWYNFDASSNDDFWTWSGGDRSFIKIVADNVYEIVNNHDYEAKKEQLYNKIQNGTASEDEEYQYKFYEIMVNTRNLYEKGVSGSANYSIISNVAQLFKTQAWTLGNNSWRADTVVIQYALLYAILVVQSLILFISYAKRLFYIIILAMLAPIAVAYDFLSKAIGNGRGVLSVWIKEFCQLVFIQTLQAFIYAIIIVLIVSLLGNNGSGMTESDYNTGLGIMAVVALVSVFKIEDLVRKMFGFGPTKADHGSAVKSIAKTAFALKLGSKVLDNGKKIVTGAGKALKTRGEAKSAREDMQEEVELQKFKRDAGKISQKEYEMNIRKLQRENKKKLGEIKAKRHEGVKSMASGFVETGGAIYGGTAGAIIGGADGNLDEATQGLLAGMGIGDTIGKVAVNVADVGISTVAIGGGKKVISKGKSAGKAVRNIHEEIKIAREEGETVAKAFSKSFDKEYKKHFRQTAQYKKDIENLYNKNVEDIE